ncbi:hypothetical protein JCM8202_002198 [Rhodotorula sphaerocarpa]
MTTPAPRAGDPLSFPVDHAHLNAKFESYKLAAPPRGDGAVVSTALPAPFHLAEVGQHARLSYQQVADRARHNHLKAGIDGELLYVDGEGRVTAVEVDSGTADLRYHPLLSLPRAPAQDGIADEYPDAAPLGPLVWLVNDGQGGLHVLRIVKGDGTWTATIGTSSRAGDEDNRSPFRLHAAVPVGDKEAFALFSTPSKGECEAPQAPEEPAEQASGLSATTRLTHRSKTTFDFQLVKISTDPALGTAAPLPLAPIWRATSDELPAFVHYDAELQRFAIGSGSRVTLAPDSADLSGSVEAETTARGQDATMDEGEDPSRSGAAPLPKPPPFSWTQDGDSVTVAFPIPSDTPTSSIRLTLSRQFVTLHIASAAAALAASSPISNAALPRLSHKKLWDSIDAHTSVWTFDREAEGRNSTYGLLTLHLEKSNPGTRWSDVFEAKPRADDAQGGVRVQEIDPEEEYEQVPEILDPSELAAISERMEQWSQSVLRSTGTDPLSQSTEGLGSGIPTSLMGEEIDVEVDGDSGKPFVVTWIEDALTASPRALCPHPTVPHSLVSTPFSSPENLGFSPTIAVQHDVDGLFYRAPTSRDDYRWTHEATFPALAFVLATKRDTRFVHHLGERACFAFDAPALLPGPPRTRPLTGGGNAFIYVSPPGAKAQRGVQHVVRVGSPSSGALVGVVAKTLASGEPAIFALCENEIVAIRVLE